MVDINSLFRSMHANYGSAWINQWPNQDSTQQAKQVWAQRLSRFAAQDIDAAMLSLGDAYPTRPPNIFQFERLCAGSRPAGEMTHKCCVCGVATKDGFMEKWYCTEHNPQMIHSMNEARKFYIEKFGVSPGW